MFLWWSATKPSLLENGTATYSAMLAAIHGAKDNINIEMFTFSDGPIGQMFADALIERQQHGVQVNVAYDGVGSIRNLGEFFRSDAAEWNLGAGVPSAESVQRPNFPGP